MIYFFQSVDGGSVKIGFTGNLDVRWKQLESHYGRPLALLATLPGGRDEEAEIHERFRDIRLGRTEQFRPTIDLMMFIGRPLLVGANPDAVEAMPPPSNGFMIRVTDEFSEAIKEAASLEKMSVADFATAFLLPVVSRRYRDTLVSKAKKVEGKK